MLHSHLSNAPLQFSIRLPDGPGIGVELRRERLAEAKARWRESNPVAPLWG